MTLTQFSGRPLSNMIASLGTASSLTVIAGAGVSAEAGLPSWRGLLEDLLHRAGEAHLGLSEPDVRQRWIGQVLDSESPLGAAAIAGALAGPDLATWIPESLYGDEPEMYEPGPIARQIAELRRSFGAGLRILTTNYDDLIEQALEDAAFGVVPMPWVGPHGPAGAPTDAGHQRIVHLHGFLPRTEPALGEVVLTEHDYQRSAQADWRSAEVGHALMNTPCVFIGSSLTDPNLLRYLHLHTGRGAVQHYAVFARQDTYPKDTPPILVAAREEALAARWRLSNVEIIFVDHYSQIAQVLAEIAHAKRAGDDYAPLPERLATWRRRIGVQLLATDDRSAFADAQDLLHEALRDALATGLATVAKLGHDVGDEVLAATLWLIDEPGASLTNWATTDRVHRDPRTVEPVPVDEYSRWVAVRAFTRGAALGEPREIYASRWRYIRGLPLVAKGDLPVGVITVASMLDEEQTILTNLAAPVEAAFDATLRAAALDLLEPGAGN